MPLLTGPAFGAAIRVALAKKNITQKALAEHFHVKPPSVQDWLKRGVVGKDKLFQLLDFFRDVVEPQHWGLQEYPAEMSALRLVVRDGGQEYQVSGVHTDLRAALQTLHEHAIDAPPSVRSELRRVNDLYWTNPARYSSLIDNMGDLLLGETTSSQSASNGEGK